MRLATIGTALGPSLSEPEFIEQILKKTSMFQGQVYRGFFLTYIL